MKHVTLSVTILLIFIFVWGFYVYNSDITINQFKKDLREDVIPQIELENWEEAQEEFQDFKNDWKDYRRLAHLFYNTTKINEIDLAISNCENYIKFSEGMEANNELANLIQLLTFLHDNEQLSMANLF